jgi:hypothetical protein
MHPNNAGQEKGRGDLHFKLAVFFIASLFPRVIQKFIFFLTRNWLLPVLYIYYYFLWIRIRVRVAHLLRNRTDPDPDPTFFVGINRNTVCCQKGI